MSDIIKIGQPFYPLIALIVAALLFPAIRAFYRRQQALRLVEEALKAVERRPLNGLLEEGEGLWLKRPIRPPANYGELKGCIPIILIATLKGGVGKTTLATNLAAYFASRWSSARSGQSKPLRVLLIDLDYQGSATTMAVDEQDRSQRPSRAARLISGEFALGELVGHAVALKQDNMRGLSIRAIPANYDLAQAENRTLIEWLLPLNDWHLKHWIAWRLGFAKEGQKVPEKDVRYVIAEALLSPQVQNSFDVAIIDAPPRLTTAHVQAMCASTHVLIPTVVDELSGDATPRYLEQVQLHVTGGPGHPERAICPHLALLGIVGTLVPPNHSEQQISGLINVLRSAIEATRIPVELLPPDTFIRQRPPYREHAGNRIAYASSSNDRPHEQLREEVDRLGEVISDRIGAGGRGWKRLN